MHEESLRSILHGMGAARGGAGPAQRPSAQFPQCKSSSCPLAFLWRRERRKCPPPSPRKAGRRRRGQATRFFPARCSAGAVRVRVPGAGAGCGCRVRVPSGCGWVPPRCGCRVRRGGGAALRVFKMKKTAHRKIKPKGDLSYSLAEVFSLAFAPSPKAPCRILD
jgi:hypothetical protein